MNPAPSASPTPPELARTGIDGLDIVLQGGLARGQLYLVEGTPGTGKTTVGLRFLMAGVALGERTLYITLSESSAELHAVAASHGWTLEGIRVHDLVDVLGASVEAEQSILHPSEVELTETVRAITSEIERLNPARVVLDSLSEMRLLAQDPLRYRRQVLALKRFFSKRECTVLLLDDKTADPTDLQLHSIAHGVITLDQHVPPFGAERRELSVRKMRGRHYLGGLHAFKIGTGHVEVFPRLVAASHHRAFDATPRGTGSPELDALLGGGLVPGTNTLLIGPSGVGKTTTAARCMLAALERGEAASYYLFDEGVATLLERTRALGMDLAPHLESGRLALRQIDPSEMSPGEFAHRVRECVLHEGARFVAIDSLNAYLQAMPGQSYLMLHMHELLTFLNQQGATTMLVVGQHGIVGDVRSEIDLSYLSDSILLFRFFEAHSEVRSAVAALKSRVAEHERTIRQFRLSPRSGLQVGDVLRGFEGVLSGLPSYRGNTPMLSDAGT